MRHLDPCPKPRKPLTPASTLTAETSQTSFDDALILVRAALPFGAWAFVQVEVPPCEAVVRATAGRSGLRAGMSVTLSTAGLAWLQQGQPLFFANAQLTATMAFSFLEKSACLGSAVLTPVFSADRALIGILVGLDAKVCSDSVIGDKQKRLLLAAARVLGTLSSLTARLERTRHQMAEVLEESMRDELTGVANRRGLLHAVRREQEGLSRQGQAVTVLFVDLDGLKLVNDAYGHDAGDDLIQRAARALASVARCGDTVARVGGDELVVLLPRRYSAKAVSTSVKRFASALSAAGVAASIGAASTEEAGDVQAAMLLADTRMMAEKKRTRTQARISELRLAT